MALAAALLASSCTTKNAPTATVAKPPTDNGTGAQRTGSASSEDVSGLTKVDVQADNFSFVPSALTGRPGQRITLVVHNTSGTLHNVTVKEQKVNSDVADGRTVLVAVTFPASGRLAFVCEYHAGRGMAGVLSTGGSGAGGPAATPAPTVRVTSGGGYGSSGY